MREDLRSRSLPAPFVANNGVRSSSLAQLAGVSGQRQLSFQRSDALVSGGQLVVLHTGHSLHDAGIDERLALHRNSVA
jgi:hypothetical protein